MEKIIYYENQETNYLVTDDGKIFNRRTGRELKGTLAQRISHSTADHWEKAKKLNGSQTCS